MSGISDCRLGSAQDETSRRRKTEEREDGWRDGMDGIGGGMQVGGDMVRPSARRERGVEREEEEKKG